MKKHFIIIALSALASTAVAVFFTEFKNWDDLTERSPEIIIAKCTGTLDLTTTNRFVITDDVIPSDIEVIAVLKGNTKPSMSHMQSWYWPHPGEWFLVFANNYSNEQFYKGYNAIENYRVVPLNRDFRTNELAGKTLYEQIQLILRHRLKDLTGELERGNEEKIRLEQGLKKGIKETVVSSNAPPAVPQTSRTQGSFF